MNIEDLEKLNELKEKGIITEEEFKREKDKVFSNNNLQPKMNDTLKTQNETKRENDNNHAGYIRWSGITLILMGICLIMNYNNYSLGNPSLVFFIPGLLGLIAGILKLSNKQDNNFLMVAGICSIVGMCINSIAICDISVYGIVSLVFGILDIKYTNRKK